MATERLRITYSTTAPDEGSHDLTHDSHRSSWEGDILKGKQSYGLLALTHEFRSFVRFLPLIRVRVAGATA